MKKALVAIDSTSCEGTIFDRFTETVSHFQRKGILPKRTSVVSLLYSSLTPLPYQFYRTEKWRLAREAEEKIKAVASERFAFDSVQVLLSDSSAAETNVALLSKFARRTSTDLVVLGSHDRSRLPYWILGSFSETAAPPSDQVVRWISNLATSVRALLVLVYVIPMHRPVVDALQMRKSRAQAKEALEVIKKKLEANGARARIHLSDESISIGHSICEFADDVRAWMILTITAERSRTRQLLLGSRARRILGLPKRSLLSMRL